MAGPIYVYHENGGVVRFSNRPPQPGVKAEIFTARGGSYSIVGRGWGGRLFKEHYKEIIVEVARRYAIDPALVRAVIHAESAFNPKAISPKGAQGLMQLMPATAQQHGVRRPFEPRENIQGGTRHLAMLLRKYNGNVKYALAAYNAGEEAVAQYGGIPPFAETREYVHRVLSLKTRYSAGRLGQS